MLRDYFHYQFILTNLFVLVVKRERKFAMSQSQLFIMANNQRILICYHVRLKKQKF